MFDGLPCSATGGRLVRWSCACESGLRGCPLARDLFWQPTELVNEAKEEINVGWDWMVEEMQVAGISKGQLANQSRAAPRA